MNAGELLRYLGALGESRGAGAAYRRLSADLVGICEKNARYLKISEYESSVPLDSAVKARLVHYILFKNGPGGQKQAGLLHAARGLALLERAGFKPACRAFLAGALERVRLSGSAFPPTIVSAEWGFKRPRVEKITVYFCFRRMSARTAALIAGLLGFGDRETIRAAGERLTFVGVDLGPEGPVSAKLYNKYRFGSPGALRPPERRFLAARGISGVSACVRVTRLFPGGKVSRDEKTHFVLKKGSPGARGLLCDPLFGRLGVLDGKKHVVSMDRRGRPAEVYFA